MTDETHEQFFQRLVDAVKDDPIVREDRTPEEVCQELAQGDAKEIVNPDSQEK